MRQILFELFSMSSMGAIVLSSYYFQNKSESNDHEKIKTIADAAGLKVKNESIRIRRRNKRKNYTEYVYQMPLGLSFKQFEENKHLFVDGLNNKSRLDFNLANFKNINWKGDVLKQVKDIFNNRIKLDKHLEIEYDGMLKFRVYEHGLKDDYPLTKDIIDKSKPWNIPLGRTLKGQIAHNFEKGAHILIGSATDMGKSTVINVIFNSLLRKHPEDVEFTLIDLKGGLELGPYKNIKQVKNFAKDVNTAKEALESVQKDMSNMFDILETKGKRNVKEIGIKKRHFVIIDEAAELTSHNESDKEVKKAKIECENYIKDIARRGRASGIRLIYSTQNPTVEVVDSQIKRNLTTRIALSTDTSTASNVILDEKGAEDLGFIKGRAIYKHNRKEEIQAYYINDDLSNKIITPHINIKAKKEGGNANRKARTDSFTLKEV